MHCFVLGTGGMMPMPRRRLTSVALRTSGWVYLFDCGEGTQVPYKELHLGQRGLRVVAVTHLHADHCLGLPGMLMLRAQMPDPGPLTVLGPPGIGRFIRHVREDLAMYINYSIEVSEWTGAERVDEEQTLELAYRDEVVSIFWAPVNHSVTCLGYRLVEHDRPGKFDAAAADALQIPFGPLRGRLQAGETITLPDGRTVAPAEVLGAPRRGRQVSFVTDTAPTPTLTPLLHEADLAFLESMFLPEHAAEAVEKKHLTVEQSVSAAQEARTRQVVLVHLSPRYDESQAQEMHLVAQRLYANARVAREREAIEVPLPD